MVRLEKNLDESEQTNLVDYEKIVASKEFQNMLSDKKKFVIPFTIFFMGYSLLLPFLVFYTDILDRPFHRGHNLGVGVRCLHYGYVCMGLQHICKEI